MITYIFIKLMRKLNFFPDGLAFIGYPMVIDLILLIEIFR